MRNNSGFSLYLTFLVTSVLFILVTSTYDISRISLDYSHSDALETIAFHSADGGLERAFGKLNQKCAPFVLNYNYDVLQNRKVNVIVKCTNLNGIYNIDSVARILQGAKVVAIKRLERIGIKSISGRNGTGKFLEAS